MYSITISVHARLMCMIPLFFLLPHGVSAQQQTSDSEQEGLEEILVTGSRVRQNPLDAKDPILTLTAEDFSRSGDISIGEYLQRLPANGSALNRTNNAAGNLGFPPDGSGVGAGSIEIDLRYLLPKRTLVLVDGRRWVRSSSASGVSGAVDLNTIPSNGIKSVEVLLDGASPIYGSDAIGGVVNIITRTDYDGFDFSTYYGAFNENDGETLNVDLSLGTSSDRSRSLFAVGYSDQKGVMAFDRTISTYAIPGFEFGLSSGTPQGSWFFTNELGNFVGVTLNDGVVNTGASNGGLPTYDPANPASGDFHEFTFDDRYNWQEANSALNPSQRVNLLVKSEYDLSDQVSARVFAVFSNRQSSSQAAPEPLFMGVGSGGGQWLESIVIPANQEFNPFGVTFGGPNGIEFFMARRPNEAGPRIFEQNVDTWHVAGGLDGSFDAAGHTWYWDMTAGWFQTDASQQKRGAFNARNIVLAAGDPAACAAVIGCVPINLFGGLGDGSGSLLPAMLNFVTFIQKDESRQEMFDISANISGSIFDLPAGPVGVAAGIEYREEDGFFVPDAVVSSGETAGVPTSPADGGFDVIEVYAEAVVPVVSRLDLSAAVRVSDYDLFSSTSVFKVGAAFAPVDTLTLRASFSEGFRAPHIGELFNRGSRFDAAIPDPCSGATGQTAQNCQQLGVPAGFISQIQQTPVLTGGNVNLEPEESENFTAGLTFDASGLFDGVASIEHLVIEANYYDIKVTNAVQAPNASDILNACINTLDPFFCDSVTRAPNGEISQIDGVLQNIAGIDTKGVDLSVSMQTRDFSIGQFQFIWISSFMSEYTESVLGPNGETISTPRQGTELGVAGRAFPKVKSTLSSWWQRNSWSAGLTATYIDEVTEDCAGFTGSFGFFPGILDLCSNGGTFGGDLGTNEMSDRIYLDFQASYRPGAMEEVEISLGIKNLTDEDPPVCRSCTINGFDGNIYPFPGRFAYLQLSYGTQ